MFHTINYCSILIIAGDYVSSAFLNYLMLGDNISESTMGCCQRRTATEKTRQVQLLMVGDIIRDQRWVVAREKLQLKRQVQFFDGGRYYQGSTMGCCQRKTATEKTSTAVDGGRYYKRSTMGCCQRKTATEKTRQV